MPQPVLVTPELTLPLWCRHPGHAGKHRIMLNSRYGGSRTPLAEYVRHALHHTAADQARWEQALEVARAVLDRADQLRTTRTDWWASPHGRDYEVEVDEPEWIALVEALFDAAEYMAINDYANDHHFADDAAAAAVFTTEDGRPTIGPLDICWEV